jgi:hypothetical protein
VVSYGFLTFLDVSYYQHGNFTEIHRARRTNASPTPHQRRTKATDAPLCSEDSSKASGAHGLLLFTACLGTEK